MSRRTVYISLNLKQCQRARFAIIFIICSFVHSQLELQTMIMCIKFFEYLAQASFTVLIPFSQCTKYSDSSVLSNRRYLLMFAKGHLHPKLQNDVKDKDLISCHLPGLLKLWKWSRTTSIRNSGQIEGNVNTTWFQLSINTKDLEMSWLIWISIMTSILIITVDSDTAN